MTIYDLVTSAEIATYWELLTQDREPYMFEELFPSEQKLGLKLEWIKGANGIPAVLKPSAFDVAAIPRERIGFESFETKMPFFKESKYVDEELRQQLNMVIESQNKAYIKMLLKNIFNDEVDLLEGAAAQRERMRAMMVTTGTIVMEGNGQVYEYDYHMPESHKVTVSKSWSDPSASIMDDIREARDKILTDTGVEATRATCSSKIMGWIRRNQEIRESLSPLTQGGGFISDSKIKQFIKDELQVEIVTNDKKYRDEQKKEQRYVSETLFVMFPDGRLGTTWFGTTPEQSDLLSKKVANVTIVDTGVAITTTEIHDPVTVETKVTQICLPDFPTADQVFIYDVVAEGSAA